MPYKDPERRKLFARDYRKTEKSRLCQRIYRRQKRQRKPLPEGHHYHRSQWFGCAEKSLLNRAAKRGDCWDFAPAKATIDYCDIKVSGRQTSAHRLSYELFCGPIPQGMFVCHTCDFPRCINPAHLFLGTAADNMADKVAKGRQARGERQGLAKLTWPAVRQIRADFTAGLASVSTLARKHGVHSKAIYLLIAGKTWRE